MNKFFRKAAIAGLLVFLVLPLILPLKVRAAERLQSLPAKPVIVIDPGHGGENQGTLEGIEDEKYMTMTTAMAMYEELCRYDNVEVYLTRTSDSDVKIADRAEFAKSVNADFLFSIHYNASEEHTLFGAEIWIPLDAPFNGYGYQFGYEFLSQLQERGLFIRGIKTRQGDHGDYYGIIRESAARGIPAVILEHCHVDEERDAEYCDSEEDFIRFGIEDATAVAKYLGLKSAELGVDYSGYQLAEAGDTAPVPGTLKDDTPPDICILELSEADYDNGTMSFTVSAADYDTPLLYYDYSIDGGVTYSPRLPWPGSNALDGSYQDTFTLSLLIPSGTSPSVILRAYNLFDLFTESNLYSDGRLFSYGQTAEPEKGTSETAPEAADRSGEEAGEGAVPAMTDDAEEKGETNFLTFLEICLGVVIVLFVLLLISQSIAYHNRKRRRRQRRKDSGASRYQPR